MVLVKQGTRNGCSRGAASADAVWVLLRAFSALQAVPEHCAKTCMRGSLRGVTGYLFFVRKIPGCFMYLLKSKQIFLCYFSYCADETC